MSATTAGNAASGSPPARSTVIRHLNDQLRQAGSGGQVLITAGVAAMPHAERATIIAAVRAFDGFTPDNDPHGEHDCAILSVGVVRVVWKIDAYDRALQFGSPDSADPAVTRRVLTIMLAEEY